MSGAISHQEAGKQRRNHFSPRGWIVLRLIVAVILLFAAGMKAWQLATSPSLSDGLLHVRWFNIIVVDFELAFGFLISLWCFTQFNKIGSVEKNDLSALGTEFIGADGRKLNDVRFQNFHLAS